MRRTLSLAILIVPLMLCTGDHASAQKAKDKMAKGKDDDVKNTEKNIKGGTVVGRIAGIEEDKRKIRISVSYPVTTIDQGQVQAMAAAQQQIAQATLQLRAARDANAYNQARQQIAQYSNQLAQAQAQLYKTEMKTKDDYYVKATDDVAVRTARPKEDFDDKGKIKKYTKTELKELRGDGKLPGYKAEYADLAVDQIIQVTLLKRKGPAPKIIPKKGKKGGDDALADTVGDGTPEAFIIQILRQPPPGK